MRAIFHEQQIPAMNMTTQLTRKSMLKQAAELPLDELDVSN